MAFGTELALAFLIIGVLMLLAELSSPGSFILVPATILIVFGAIGLVAPDWVFNWWSPLVAIAIGVPMTVIAIKMYQKLAPPAPPETTVASSLVGMKGIVETEVKPNTLKGKVRIEHETWSATSEKVIPAGKKVVVKSSEGVHVMVEEIP